MPPDPQKVQAIFHEAVERHAAAGWPAFLDQACGDDVDLRHAVEALLRGHEHTNSLLDQPALGSATVAESSTAVAGTMIGPYKMLEQIGEGGFGVVYMAEQTEPVRRKVALKILKPGMDTRQVIARFEAERQALAIMDHPNIAKVFDGGMTGVRRQESGVRNQETGLTPDSCLLTPDAGRPYFVMELVKGVPITEFCDQNHLSPRQRLELFIPVCHAVQHAHQKGIIHRDLKPSNILVVMHDTTPVPKVIDFGIAKALGQELTDKTLFTGFAQMVGTPLYMSPEQAGQSGLDIDTRSDIYSLGVLLYELLTGTTPFDKERFKQAAYDEIRRIIREEDPPKPSTRLSHLSSPHAPREDPGHVTRSVTATLASVAAQRHTEPAKLTKLIRGELDWIVMKALEKDRNRRYETANGFAMDVQRYLADEPVQACPPSAGYRLRKFVRRNKGPVLTAALVMVVLVVGIVGTTWGMIRASLAEADAVQETKQKVQALLEKEGALGAAKAAQLDAEANLKDALGAVDQLLTRVSEERLMHVPQMESMRRQLLEDALKFYQKFLQRKSDDPVVRRETALAMCRMSGIHQQLGQDSQTEETYRAAVAIFAQLPRATAEDRLVRVQLVYSHLMFYWTLAGQSRHEEAVQILRNAVATAEELVAEFPDQRLVLLNARNTLAFALLPIQPDESEKMLRQNLLMAANDDVYVLAQTYHGLGKALQARGRLSEAEDAWRRSMDYREKLAAAWPAADWVRNDLAFGLVSLARVLTVTKQFAKARECTERALVIQEKLVTDFPTIPSFRSRLASVHAVYADVLKHLQKTDEATAAYRRAAEVYEKLAVDFPQTPTHWQSALHQRLQLGQFLQANGKLQEAQKIYEELGSLQARLAEDVSSRFQPLKELVRIHVELGLLHAREGKAAEADAAFRQAVMIQEKLHAEHGPKVEHRRELIESAVAAGKLLKNAGRTEDAEKVARLALKHLDEVTKDAADDPKRQSPLADLCYNLGQLLPTSPDGEKCLQLAVQLRGKFLAHAPTDFHARKMQGHNYRELGHRARQAPNGPEQAEKYFRLALPLIEGLQAEAPANPLFTRWLANTQYDIGKLQFGKGDPQHTEEWFHRSVLNYEKSLAVPDSDPALDLGSVAYRLSDSYLHWRALLTRLGRDAEAAEVLERALKYFAARRDEGTDAGEFQTELARMYNWRGVAHTSSGRHKDAEADHRRAFDLYQSLLEGAASKPGELSRRARREQSWTCGNLAGALTNLGRLEEALQVFRQCVALGEKSLAMPEPDSVGVFAYRLSESYLRWRALLTRLGRDAEAAEVLERALKYYAARRDEGVNAGEFQAELARMHNWRGLAHANSGRHKDAEADHRRAFDLYQSLLEGAASKPGELSHKARRELSWSCGNLAEALTNLGRLEEALQVFSQGIALGEKLHADYPKGGYVHWNANLWNGLAWVFSTAADPRCRSPERAVEFAQKAVALSPQTGMFWNTLGAAHYRAGAWKDALDALEKSMKLRKGGDSNDWFFVAMARGQLGEKDEARAWYAKAVQWMEANQPRNGELIRFRNEAAELLKVESKK